MLFVFIQILTISLWRAKYPSSIIFLWLEELLGFRKAYATNSLTILLHQEKIFISFPPLKFSSLGIENFQYFKYKSSVVLWPVVSDKTSISIYSDCCSLHVVGHFSPGCFRFSLYLVFSSLTMICLGLIFFVSSCLGFTALKSTNCLSPNLGDFQALLLKLFFLLQSFLRLMYTYIRPFAVVSPPRGLYLFSSSP